MSNVPTQQPGDEGFPQARIRVELDSSLDDVVAQSFKNELEESAAQIGQDDWFRAQTKDGRRNRVPYSSRSPVTLPINGEVVGKEGHQGLMSYDTMKSIASSPDAVTKEALKEMLTRDFQAVGYNLDFGYLDSIPEEQFRAWMQDVATKRIHDNDAWGKTAIGFMQAKGIDILKLKSGELTEEQTKAIFDLKYGINSVWNPKNSADFRQLFEQNNSLRVAMTEAHKNWRAQTYQEMRDVEFNTAQVLDVLKERLLDNSFDTSKLSEEIKQIRDLAHTTKDQSPEMTFELMLQIAEVLEAVAASKEVAEDIEKVAKILKQRNDLLDTIRYDANLAIADSIIKLGNLKDQSEG